MISTTTQIEIIK